MVELWVDEVLEKLKVLAEKPRMNISLSSHRKHLRARVKEGATLPQMLDVLDLKIAEWKHDLKMCKYLRPSTLYGADKFWNYVDEVELAKQNPDYANKVRHKNKGSPGSTRREKLDQFFAGVA